MSEFFSYLTTSKIDLLLPSIVAAPQKRRELYREIFAQISNAYIGLLCADPQHPDFWPYLNQAYRFAGPNPDDS